MWDAYIVTAAFSALVGLSFYPKDHYRYWWQWLHDERWQVVLSVLGFCVINGLLAAAVYAGASAADVGSDDRPATRILAAVITTQALLRGQAPRYGRKADAESTLVRIGTDWLMGDLDKKAVVNVVDLCEHLDYRSAVALADLLHGSCSERDPSVPTTVRKNERTRIEQARAAEVAEQEQQKREMRGLCREIILRSHAVLKPRTWNLYFGDAVRSGSRNDAK